MLRVACATAVGGPARPGCGRSRRRGVRPARWLGRGWQLCGCGPRGRRGQSGVGASAELAAGATRGSGPGGSLSEWVPQAQLAARAAAIIRRAERPGPRRRGSAGARERRGPDGGRAGTCGAGSKHQRRTPTRRGRHGLRAGPNDADCPRARRGGASATRKRTCVLPYVVPRTDAGVCKATCKRGHTCSAEGPRVARREWDCSSCRTTTTLPRARLTKRPHNAGFERDQRVRGGRGGRCAGEGPAP